MPASGEPREPFHAPAIGDVSQQAEPLERHPRRTRQAHDDQLLNSDSCEAPVVRYGMERLSGVDRHSGETGSFQIDGFDLGKTERIAKSERSRIWWDPRQELRGVGVTGTTEGEPG